MAQNRTEKSRDVEQRPNRIEPKQHREIRTEQNITEQNGTENRTESRTESRTENRNRTELTEQNRTVSEQNRIVHNRTAQNRTANTVVEIVERVCVVDYI